MIETKEQKSAKNYFKWATIALYFYMGIRVLMWGAFLFMDDFVEAWGYIDILLNLGISAFGISVVYHFSKGKGWALIVLATLFVVAGIFGFLSQGKVPVIQLVFLVLTLNGFRHLKNFKRTIENEK